MQTAEDTKGGGGRQKEKNEKGREQRIEEGGPETITSAATIQSSSAAATVHQHLPSAQISPNPSLTPCRTDPLRPWLPIHFRATSMAVHHHLMTDLRANWETRCHPLEIALAESKVATPLPSTTTSAITSPESTIACGSLLERKENRGGETQGGRLGFRSARK